MTTKDQFNQYLIDRFNEYLTEAEECEDEAVFKTTSVEDRFEDFIRYWVEVRKAKP
jgi:hypothetical protein